MAKADFTGFTRHFDNPGPRKNKIFDLSSAGNPDGEERRENPRMPKRDGGFDDGGAKAL